MSVGSCGGGRISYGCLGYTWEGEGEERYRAYEEGRSFVDKHYSDSHVEFGDYGDSRVRRMIEIIDALRKKTYLGEKH